MKWTIDKSFSFAYGHRVWSQTLNTDFTENNDGCLACRHLHGHEGLVKVHLSAENLDQGMVVDFKMLGWFKNFLDDVLDHKFIMDINDPLLAHEAPEFIEYNHNGDTSFAPKPSLAFNKCTYAKEGYWVPNLTTLASDINPAVIEKYEGMVFVDFVPTSENLSAWLLKIAKNRMAEIGVDVVAIEFWETPKSHCKVEV